MDDVSRQPAGDQLTQRELEILRLVAQGLTNKAIAEQLFLGAETVKWYIKQIFSKLHVGSRIQAITTAQAAGLLDGTPAKSVPLAQYTLPYQPTPFIGRVSELAQLDERLTNPDCRLVSVVGPGGIGKTRLVLEVAAAQLTRFRDGAYFVGLAPLSDPNLIPTVIADTVNLSFAPGEPPKNQLLNYLRDRQMLLVLDNFEHLLAGVNLISELLQHAPNIKLIVTSRERLQLQNEVIFRLEGFSFSDWATPQTAAESSAVRLFLQSARLVNPSFELTHDVLGDLSSICRLVDGMPLGILLAASWIDTLSIAEIAQEIERSFEFLEGNWRDLPERQRSLRAVFEQSWKLLNDEERFAMCCFSIFRGGFTREAAQQVADTSLKTLNSLVNKSLLIRDSTGRFDVHELLRQYSASELDHLYNERQQVQTRYAAYYARFMDDRWTSIRSANMKVVADGIELEIDNIRTAWQYIVNDIQPPLLLMTARVLWYFLMVRSHYEEGINLFSGAVSKLRSLPASDQTDLALGEVLHNLGFFYSAKGRVDEAKHLAEESITILQGHNAVEILVRAYITLCRSEFLLGEYQSGKQHVQRGIDLAHHLSDPWYLGPCLFLLGMIAVHLNEYDEAFRAGKEALLYLEQAEDLYYQGLCFGLVLGRAALRMGHYEDAKNYYLRSIPYFESIHDYFEIAQSNRDCSEVYALLREYDAAKRAYQNSMSYYAKAGQRAFLISNLHSVSRLFEMQGDYVNSVEMTALLISHPVTLPVDRLQAKIALTRLQANLSASDFSAAYERGKTLDLDIVVMTLLNDTNPN